MGISIKTAGITIGGLTALWLVNKGLNILNRAIDTMSETGKWKAYYKYGEHEHAVPPGYARYGDWKSPEQQEADRKEQAAEERKTNREPVDMKPIGESLEKIAKAYFKTKGIDLDRSNRTTYARYSDGQAAEEWKTNREAVKEEIAETLDIPKATVDKALDDLPEEEEEDGKIVAMPVKEETADDEDIPQ